VALANKEVLVVAGELVSEAARRRGVPILPVDSEHNAIWQCLRGEAPLGEWAPGSAVSRLILTASGGAFRDHSPEQLARVTAAEALKHPNWVMGPKVTVDSATVLNKGFEVIEARWLFGVPYERIGVLLHRESVVHSLVEFADGSVKAQLGPPDMRLPIQYALTYPDRCPSPVQALDLAALGRLTFGPLDEAQYSCFRLAREAALAGRTYPAALSGADESAVAMFLSGEIGFLEISRLIEETLADHEPAVEPDLQCLIGASDWAATRCREIARRARVVRQV
jgi:1-deoxy-D-xylulose-5-phosphate reductoisomerase